MRVDIDEIQSNSYKSLVKDINNAARKFRIESHKINPKMYRNLLLNTNISIEKKKKELIKHLHETVVKTFSININKVKSKKALLENLKNNLSILRAIVDKLRSINNYLEESFLMETGLKKSSIELLKTKNPKRILTKKSYLGKKDLERLEHTVYSLIEKIIFLDKRLLKGYKKKEENIIRIKKVETKDIESVLKKESEILMHLEAKLPPAGKVKSSLIKDQIMHNWIPRIFALLSSFESEYQKENMIFRKLKGNERLRKKINRKIKQILIEKEKLLRLKEKKALSIEKLRVDDEWRLIFYQFNAATRL